MEFRYLIVWLALLATIPGVNAGPLEDGIAAFEALEYQQAMELLRPLAEQGDMSARVKTGIMYARGLGVKQDAGEALKWFRQAVLQGSAEAEFGLGNMYETGLGIPLDTAAAIKWYRAAGRRGHAGAQYRLGVIYFRGEGVSTDYVTAYAWMSAAAAQDHSRAASYSQMIADVLTPEKLTEARALGEELLKE